MRLAGREIIVKLLQLVGSIVLARVLAPSTFGIFAIAYFAINLFAVFSELGLGAALIRKPGDLGRHELEAVFTCQLAFILGLSSILFLVAPVFVLVYKVPNAVWVVRALSIALFLTSLRTVPVVIAERRLAYGPIAVSDLSRHLTFWVVAVLLALAGFGVWSLVAAVIVSSGVGTAVLYARTGWRPALRFEWRPIQESVRFGLTYQGQSATHFAKDTIIPALGGLLYGSVAVGYLTWAEQYAFVPLLLTGLVARVSYPALARLQNDARAFASMLESTLRWTCLLSFPLFAVMVGLAPQVIELVYGSKWLPALPSAYLLFLNMALGVGTGVLMPALYSMGRASTGLRISVGWMAATWLFALVFASLGVGFAALAAAYALGTVLALAAIVLAVRRLGEIDIVGATLLPVSGAGVIAIMLHLLAPLLVNDVASLVVLGAVAAILGFGINLWGKRFVAFAAIKSLRTSSLGRL
ncbi:MAG TPA: oligosaccharide flippase family protein [Candidatus Dormibacteraeota bacterium]|nr:oligosaccharide flippase family protein [Candidatus Dormibacteraeota bacterium]